MQVNAIDVESIPALTEDEKAESPDSSFTNAAVPTENQHEMQHRPDCETGDEKEARRSLISALRPGPDSVSTATRETSFINEEIQIKETKII